MLRHRTLCATIGLPLLFAACDNDSSAPAAADAQPASPARSRVAATIVDHFRLGRAGADASFMSADAFGCIQTTVNLFAAEQSAKEGPAKPEPVPIATVFVSRLDLCSGEVIRSLEGSTDQRGFHVDATHLDEARLQAAIPTTDLMSGAEVPVELTIDWRGNGSLETSSQRSAVSGPGFLSHSWIKGAHRDAAATGTVVVQGEDFTPEPAVFADIFRAREGGLEIERSR
jgi:hypothetical protein